MALYSTSDRIFRYLAHPLPLLVYSKPWMVQQCFSGLQCYLLAIVFWFEAGSSLVNTSGGFFLGFLFFPLWGRKGGKLWKSRNEPPGHFFFAVSFCYVFLFFSPQPPFLYFHRPFLWLSPSSFYCLLLAFTEFYLVLLGFAGFYWFLLGFTGFYWV